MAEENQEGQDLDKPDEDNTSQNNESDEGEDLSDQIKSLQAQKEHWRSKYERVAEAIQEDAADNDDGDTEDNDDATPSSDSDISSLREEIKQEVLLTNKGYSDDEIALIKRNTSEGESLTEVANKPFVQGGIEKLREEKKAEAETPPPSNRKADVSGEGSDNEDQPVQTWEDYKKQQPEGNVKSFQEWKARKKERDSME